jgi:hypothetical protein
LERKIKIPAQPGGQLVDGFEVPILESVERWTELTLEDGAVIRIKPMVLGVVRLDNQWDQENNPLYAIRGGQNVMTIVSVPDRLKKPATPATQRKAN